jgi:hypothetical protein
LTPDVFTAVGELVKVQQIRVEYLPGKTYRAYAPCRLGQLADAVAASTSGSGGHSKPGSRIPIAADQLDLYRDIAMAVGLWAYALGVDRSGLRGGRPYGAGTTRARFETPPLGRLMVKVAGEAMRLRRFEMADRIGHDSRKWAGRIDAMLPQPRLRPDGSMVGRPGTSSIRGRACPNCDSIDVVDVRDDDGTYRVPALQISYAEVEQGGLDVPFWWCRVPGCGHWGWLQEPSDIEQREAS